MHVHSYDEESGEYSVNPNAVWVKTAYNYDKSAESAKFAFDSNEATRTKQEFKDECDINVIIDRFGIGQEMPMAQRVPINAEFTDNLTYHEAMNMMIEADRAFYSFPAAIRERFANDPGKFVDFVSDPKNKDQCQEWGLNRPVAVEPSPMRVRVVPEEKPAEKP